MPSTSLPGSPGKGNKREPGNEVVDAYLLSYDNGKKF